MTTLPPPLPVGDAFAPLTLYAARYREAHARFLEQDADQWAALALDPRAGYYDAERYRHYAAILKSRAAMVREGKADLP